MTQLRGERRALSNLNYANSTAIETMFKKMAGSSTSLAEEAVMLLPSMLRASIREYFLP